MIDLRKNETRFKRAIELARKYKIIIPTFKQMKNPKLIPGNIKEKLKGVGLEDLNPYNLFNVDELNAQWYDYPYYWKNIQSINNDIDKFTGEFNKKTGLL
jgi:hypothetical protein